MPENQTPTRFRVRCSCGLRITEYDRDDAEGTRGFHESGHPDHNVKVRRVA